MNKFDRAQFVCIIFPLTFCKNSKQLRTVEQITYVYTYSSMHCGNLPDIRNKLKLTDKSIFKYHTRIHHRLCFYLFYL